MKSGIATVAWKEGRELRSEFLHGKGRIQVALLVVVGIFMGMSGRNWVTDSTSAFMMTFFGVLAVTMVVADIVCGERERHTLDTLLASRLSEGEILLGKALTVFLYGVGVTLLTYIASIASADVYLHAGLLLPSGTLLATTLVGLVLGAAFATALGVLVAIRATSVKQTQMLLSFGLMIPMFGAMYGWEALSISSKAEVIRMISWLGLAGSLAVTSVAVLLSCAALLGIARLRFQRARMLLD